MGAAMTTGQQTINLLRNQMASADLREMTPEQLRQFEELCYHWQRLACSESVQRKGRANTVNRVLCEGANHG